MKRNLPYGIYKLAIVITLILGVTLFSTVYSTASSGNAQVNQVKAPYSLKIVRAGEKAVVLKWTKVNSVSGYQVFRYNAQKKKYVRVKTLKGKSAAQWTDKDITANKKYTYKVRAFVKSGGGTKYSPFTYSVNAIANKPSSKKANAGDIQSSITVKTNYEETKLVKGRSSINIGIGESVIIGGSALPSKKDKKKGKKVLSKKTRLMVTESGNIANSGKGRIIGKLPGNANVYLMAHNGYKKQVKVKVIDYAYPKKWKNLDEVDSYPAQFLNECKDDMCKVASYFSMHGGGEYGFQFGQGSDGNLEIKDDPTGPTYTENQRPDLAGVMAPIKNIIINSPYLVGIRLTIYGDVTFVIKHPNTENDFYEISFSVQFDTPEEELSGSLLTKLAPHWEYWKVPISGI